jgi:autotransporter-associated beta strand protein
LSKLGTNNATLSINRTDSSTLGNTVSGTGALTKSGAGTAILGASNNFTGATVVTGGVLNLNSSAGAALGSTASVSVTNATLLISQSDQVSNTAAVTLSGGTIAKGAGVINETMGALTLSSTSFLDFGMGTGNFTFSTFTPGAFQLTLQNFNVGNSLTVTTGTFAAGAFNFSSFDYSWDVVPSGGFTITAIPEPSTVLAALGLAGLMLWPVARRKFLG